MCPPSSVSKSILRSTLKAIVAALFTDQETTVVHFPSIEEGMLDIVADHKGAFGLPGAVGAVDGTLIHMKKPAADMAGGDNDALWCYKGYVATLALCTCDNLGRVTWMAASALGY